MLMVMRHGKSDWSTGTTDHDRPLNRRGIRSAERMGALVTEIGHPPDLVISSTARRAATTAERAAQAGRWDCEIRYLDSFYETSPGGVIDELRSIDDKHSSCLVVGHNPTWSALVHRLTGGSVAMRTATIAMIEGPASWAWLGDYPAELVAVLQPRHFLPSG